MIFIVGGAYQGKLGYALDRFSITREDVYFCRDDSCEIDYSKPAISGLHLYILALLKSSVSPEEIIAEIVPRLQGKIILCDDINNGVVPEDPLMRKWRESTGRCAAYLSGKSEEVIRLFCGIPTRLK